MVPSSLISRAVQGRGGGRNLSFICRRLYAYPLGKQERPRAKAKGRLAGPREDRKWEMGQTVDFPKRGWRLGGVGTFGVVACVQEMAVTPGELLADADLIYYTMGASRRMMRRRSAGAGGSSQ